MAQQWSRMFPAFPHQVRHAREFARAVLGDNPLVDQVELVVSELATNSVTHSKSGEFCSSFIVGLEVADWGVRVIVADMGSRTPINPRPEMPSPDEEYGRGLAIVAALAKQWGRDTYRNEQRVWAELSADPPSA